MDRFVDFVDYGAVCCALEIRRLSVPLLGLAYPEFQYVLNRERQRKVAQTRLARRQARVFLGVRHCLPVLVWCFDISHESLAGEKITSGVCPIGFSMVCLAC